MAILYISEYASLADDENEQDVMVGREPAIAEQTVAIGATSTQSSAFNARTKFVMIHTDVLCYIKFGSSPTAVVEEPIRLVGDAYIFTGVNPGQSHKVAVIVG